MVFSFFNFLDVVIKNSRAVWRVPDRNEDVLPDMAIDLNETAT